MAVVVNLLVPVLLVWRIDERGFHCRLDYNLFILNLFPLQNTESMSNIHKGKHGSMTPEKRSQIKEEKANNIIIQGNPTSYMAS